MSITNLPDRAREIARWKNNAGNFTAEVEVYPAHVIDAFLRALEHEVGREGDHERRNRS